jgi:hypothetical protein
MKCKTHVLLWLHSSGFLEAKKKEQSKQWCLHLYIRYFKGLLFQVVSYKLFCPINGRQQKRGIRE